MLAGLMLFLLLSRGAAAGHQSDPVRPIHFDRDIRPILSDACYACHGPDSQKRKAGLRIDLKEGLFGPTRDEPDTPDLPARIVAPSDPAASELLRRVLSDDPDEQMPPPAAARQLTAAEKSLLQTWISAGAPWSGHWAFEPVVAPALPAAPATASQPWGVNEIDRFVLAALREHDPQGTLHPSPPADPRTLIRRLSLDLTGLPPTPDEAAAYLADTSPDAWTRLIDRLLASPRFGEHMAEAWMEVARYSDSNGFQLDLDRTAWPWRDWVVSAFNNNLPYDQFITDQIAGDMLPSPTAEQILATAFNRNHPINGEGGRDIEESRIDYVHDRVDATSTAFLGLTMSCAQCHDHKYDPITQRDYYRFFAYFNSVDETGAGDAGDMAPLTTLHAVETPAGPKDLNVMVMHDRAEPRETHMLIRGAWDHPGETVAPATPSALPALSAAPPTRLGLAQWLTDPSNPLTARVAVNRFWQQLFGQGLVRTPENFGTQGDRPTHAELLDFLAARFIASGWNTKALLRDIVTSATYRQSSACSPELLERDPENRLLARAPRFRLPAGVIRDQALFASGLLVEQLGGPPVKPYHPSGVWEDVSFGRLKYEQGLGADLYRRSLYTFWRRTAPPANMFDASLRQRCSVRVIRTNTPLQSLILLNDPTYAEAAAALAARVLREVPASDDQRLTRAWELILARPPTPRELGILTARLGTLREYYAAHPDLAAAAACAGASPDPAPEQFTQVAAHAGVCAVILNLDETLTRE